MILAGLHKSRIPFLVSTCLFSRNTMIFTSLALLSGMVLFPSAAPLFHDRHYSHNEVVHIVNVSNDTAGLVFDPSYVVSKQTCSSHHIPLVLTILSSRPPKRESASRLFSIKRTTP